MILKQDERPNQDFSPIISLNFSLSMATLLVKSWKKSEKRRKMTNSMPPTLVKTVHISMFPPKAVKVVNTAKEVRY